MPSRRHGLRRMLLAAVLAVALLVNAVAAESAPEIWLRASLDHVDSGLTVLLVQRADGSRWLRVIDLATLGLPVPGTRLATHNGEAIVALEHVGIAAVIDESGRSIQLFSDPAAHALALDDGDMLLDVTINRQVLAGPQWLRVSGGELLLSAETQRAAGVAEQVIAAHGGEWAPLHALAGEAFVFDLQRLTLDLDLAADRFAGTQVAMTGNPEEQPDLAPAPLAAIIGYDVAAGADAHGSWQSLLLDATVSREGTNCRSRHLWRSVDADVARLDSACIIDWPDRALSLSVGDGISGSGPLGASIRYGGVRLGTDYALQPHLTLQPLVKVEGEARLPSVIELWMNQQLALRTELPPGAFEIEGIPLRAGAGQMEAFVIDEMGRRSVLSAPFYSSATLLRPGLTDWALELGWKRVGFLSNDDRYTDPFVLASWRRGITNNITLGARGEQDAAGGTWGATASFVLGRIGVTELAAARSQRDGQTGNAYMLGHSYRGRRFSIGGQWLQRDPGFTDLGWSEPGTAPRSQLQLSGGTHVGGVSISLSAVAREDADGIRQRLATAALGMRVGNAGHLSLTALKLLDPSEPPRITLTYTMSLSQRSSFSAFASDDGGASEPGLVYRRSQPIGPGYGIRAAYLPQGDITRAAVDASLRSSHLLMDASLSQSGGQTAGRLGVSGGLLLTGDGVFAVPDAEGSFAVVDLPGADVGVQHENQIAARTNRNGKAVVSRLRPFERNRLAMLVEDLPLQSDPGARAIEIVPGRRTVSRAAFSATTQQYLAGMLRRLDGRVVPAGAIAMFAGHDDGYPVGHDGQIFVEIPTPPADLVVRWNRTESCVVLASMMPAVADLAENVPLECR